MYHHSIYYGCVSTLSGKWYGKQDQSLPFHIELCKNIDMTRLLISVWVLFIMRWTGSSKKNSNKEIVWNNGKNWCVAFLIVVIFVENVENIRLKFESNFRVFHYFINTPWNGHQIFAQTIFRVDLFPNEIYSWKWWTRRGHYKLRFTKEGWLKEKVC